jgi:stress-induced morphogen
MGQIEEQIQQKLIDKLNPCELNIINQSHLHSSHFKGLQNGESHFKIIIKADILSSMTRLKAHRLINDILKDEIKSSIHALSIEIK